MILMLNEEKTETIDLSTYSPPLTNPNGSNKKQNPFKSNLSDSSYIVENMPPHNNTFQIDTISQRQMQNLPKSQDLSLKIKKLLDIGISKQKLDLSFLKDIDINLPNSDNLKMIMIMGDAEITDVVDAVYDLVLNEIKPEILNKIKSLISD